MFAEFNWWLLIVGLVVGAGLAWLVLGDARRREEDVEEAEIVEEAAWLDDAMADAGTPLDPGAAEQVLRLHRRYLGLPRPDEPDEVARAPVAAGEPATSLPEPEPRIALPPATPAARAEAEDEPTVRSRG